MSRSCPNCQSVHFFPRRLHRHGSVAVFLGHALLVPGVLTLALGSMGVVARPRDSAELVHVAEQTLSELRAWDVPSDMGEAVVEARKVGADALAALSGDQREKVLGAQARMADARTRVSLDGLTSRPAFLGLLASAAAAVVVGFTLTRKRSTLCCTNCSLPQAS